VIFENGNGRRRDTGRSAEVFLVAATLSKSSDE
jgi:hypothetical protein